MGFGLLFFGYLLCINNIAYPGFTKIFAYLVMLLAMVRLCQYNRYLRAAYHALFPTAILGGVYLFIEAASAFSLFSEDLEILLFRVVPLGLAVLEAVFLFHLLKGLFALAEETDVVILKIASFRNRLFTCAYYFLHIIGQLDYGTGATRFLVYYNLVIMLVGFVVMLMNAKLFYNFYMWICLPEDVEMEKKPSKPSLLGRLQRRLDDATDKQLEDRIATDKEYREQQQKRKDERKRK